MKIIIILFVLSFVNSIAQNDQKTKYVPMLFEKANRDYALKQLLIINNYYAIKDNPDYRIKYDVEEVKSVVRCPQLEGNDLLAVFIAENFDKRYNKSDSCKGHIEIFDMDGNIVHYYQNANVIDGVFEDINNDGIIETVQSILYGGCDCPIIEVITVVPIIRKMKSKLVIILDSHMDSTLNRASSKFWSWRVTKSLTDDNYEIQLGPKDRITKELQPTVIYKWSKKMKKYVGPKGGTDFHYMAMNEFDNLVAKKFANARNSFYKK